jgi:hypothetical protein
MKPEVPPSSEGTPKPYWVTAIGAAAPFGLSRNEQCRSSRVSHAGKRFKGEATPRCQRRVLAVRKFCLTNDIQFKNHLIEDWPFLGALKFIGHPSSTISLRKIASGRMRRAHLSVQRSIESVVDDHSKISLMLCCLTRGTSSA